MAAENKEKQNIQDAEDKENKKGWFQKTGEYIVETKNYYVRNSLSKDELKYFDAYVGVQLDYFNELEVNVKNPYELNKFSDFYKKYKYGTYELYNPYYGYSEYLPIEAIERINFIALFNEIFSPSIFSKPLANAYYDVETGKLLYNSEGIQEVK